MGTYVMSDIHGEYDKFIKMLELIEFDAEDRLIVLGDVIDRGTRPIDILLYMMNSPNIEFIIGNHEKMMLRYLLSTGYDKHIELSTWISNGGGYTISQFNKLSKEEQVKIARYLAKAPWYKVVDKYVLVHAGINTTGINRAGNIEDIMRIQDEEDLLWSREEFYEYPGVEGYTVIFGHTPTPNLRNKKEFSIWHDPIYKDKIGIDCGAVYEGGLLGCLRLEDMKEFYIK